MHYENAYSFGALRSFCSVRAKHKQYLNMCSRWAVAYAASDISCHYDKLHLFAQTYSVVLLLTYHAAPKSSQHI